MSDHDDKNGFSFLKLMNGLTDFLNTQKALWQFPFEAQLTSSYIFKLAESEDEITEALSLLNQAHEQADHLPYRQPGLYSSKGFALPGTKFFVAKYHDLVVATSALIPDSAFGLPSDNLTTLAERRKNGRLLAEMTSPVVRESHMKDKKKFFFPLLKLILFTCTNIEKLDALLVIPSLSSQSFFKHLLQFNPLPLKASGKSSTQKKGPQLIPHYLELNEKKLAEWSQGSHRFNQRKPIFEYIFQATLLNIQWPQYGKTLESSTKNQTVSKMDIMKKFPHLLEDWGPKDFQIIANLDIHKLFLTKNKKTSSESNVISLGGIRDRKSPRAEVRLKGWAFFPGETQLRESLIIDLSEEGFQLKANPGQRPLRIGEEFVLVFEINDQLVHLESKIQWIRNDTRIGCSLKESSSKWQNLVQEVYGELIGQAKHLPRKNS